MAMFWSLRHWRGCRRPGKGAAFQVGAIVNQFKDDLRFAREQGLVETLEAHDPEFSVALLPDFPETAWRGLFAAYRGIVGPTTEASDVYHYFCFALGLGATLGRRSWINHAVPLFPNFFVALVGRTGMARKDTSRARINQMIVQLNLNPIDERDAKFLLLPGIGSAEGLIESLAGTGKVVVAQESELLSLMSKARRDATSNLIPHLTALYDCPDLYTLKTRQNPVTCRDTFLSFLAGTTPVWLLRSLTDEHIQGGFANRFIFAFGSPKEPIAFPPTVDSVKWDNLIHQVNKVRLRAQEIGEIAVEQSTKELFKDWYGPYHTRVSADGHLPALAVRYQSFAWKLSLLYAVQEGADTIHTDHLQPAFDVVEWLWHSTRAAFLNLVGHGRDLEATILDRLADGPLSKRYLYRALKISAPELQKATSGLLAMGLITEESVTTEKGGIVDGFALI